MAEPNVGGGRARGNIDVLAIQRRPAMPAGEADPNPPVDEAKRLAGNRGVRALAVDWVRGVELRPSANVRPAPTQPRQRPSQRLRSTTETPSVSRAEDCCPGVTMRRWAMILSK